MTKGFDGWIEVFKTGEHKDSKGRVREYNTGDLDRIVDLYDPSNHEAPLVVGHPDQSAPAYGWVEDIKRQGEKLLAKCKQVMPAFEQAVKDGRFKKRSISVHPKFGLRHIGFLGSMAPAVKGLADIQFNSSKDDEAIVVELDIQQFSDEAKEVYSMTIEELKKQLAEKDKEIQSFSEQLQTKDTKIAELEQELEKQSATSAQFSEQQTDILKAQQAEIDQLKAQAMQKECEDFCDGLIKSGKLAPANRQGTIELMMSMDDKQEHDYSEGGSKTQLQRYKETLQAAPVVMSFSEFATEGVESVKTAEEIQMAAHKYMEEKQQAGFDISIADAVTAVTREGAQ